MRVWVESNDIQIVMIQEPYAKTVAWQGWKWHRTDFRSKTVTWVKSDIAATLDESRSTGNITWITIPSDKGTINIVNVYDEPAGAGKASKWNAVFHDLQSTKPKILLLAGDLNAKNMAWGADSDDVRGVKIIDDCSSEGILLGNDPSAGPTFVGPMGSSWVDLTLYRGCHIGMWVVHEDESLSDHAYISFSLQTGSIKKRSSRAVYDYARANWGRIEDKLRDWHLGPLDERTQLEIEAVKLQTVMSEACRENIPRKVVVEGETTWWNAELAKARADSRKQRKEYQNTRNPDNRHTKALAWKAARTVYKTLVKKAKQAALSEVISTLCEKESWSRVWESLRKLSAGKGETGIWCEDATYTTDGDTIDENLLAKYHPQCDVAELANLELWQKQVASDRADSTASSVAAITVLEVSETVRAMKNGKACGGDAIPNEALKAANDGMADRLARLYTKCVEQGYFPNIWKIAKVVWLPKPKGGYRPISLLPAFGRVFDKILDARLKNWMERTGAVSERQYGFREGRDTVMAISKIIGDIQCKRKKEHSMVVLLDLSNAFNMAWPPHVYEELREAKVPLYLRRVVASFMTDRKIQSGRISMDMKRGCPQGSSMGPTLWILSMQSWFRALGDETEKVKTQAYADDQCIVVSGSSVKKIEATWSEVWDKCRKWEVAAKMSYNLAKTEMLFVPAGRKVRTPVISVGAARVEASDKISYLGVTLDWRLDFAGHIAEIRKKASKLAPRFKALLRSRSDFTKDTARVIYDRVVRPGLLYGAEIWGSRAAFSASRKQLLITQRMFLRSLVPCYATTSTQALMVIAGTIPLHIEAERINKAYEEQPRECKLKQIVSRWNFAELQTFSDSACRREEMSRHVELYVDYSSIKRATAYALKERGNIITGHCEASGTGNDTVGGELEAIQKGLEVLQLQNAHIDVFSDSREALNLVARVKANASIVANIQAKLRELLIANSVTLNWLQSANNPADQVLKHIPPYRHTETESRKERKRRWEQWALGKWQTEWYSTDKGRELHGRCSEIGTDRLPLTFKGVQLATGHGNFGAYLDRFALVAESAKCKCGEANETLQHILESCSLNNRIAARRTLARNQWAFRTDRITDTDAVRCWNELADEMLETEDV